MQFGYSFCPNDTFIFYALAHQKVASPWPIEEVLEDVETLNLWAFEGKLPLTKIIEVWRFVSGKFRNCQPVTKR